MRNENKRPVQPKMEPTSLSARQDEELFNAYADTGSRAAFEELVHRYERELYAYLRRYLCDAGLAEDAFQGTFLQLHLKCGQYDRSRAFRPWLYTIATHQAIDLLRANRRHKHASLNVAAKASDSSRGASPLLDLLESTEIDPSQRVESAEAQRRVRAAMNRLPKLLRQVLDLVDFQGLKYQEVADLLGIPLGTVKSRRHAALGWLQSAVTAQAAQ